MTTVPVADPPPGSVPPPAASPAPVAPNAEWTAAALVQHLARPDPEFLAHVSVDCVVFGFHAAELKLLLVRWKHLDAWSLPGGFVGRREPVDGAAQRVLRDRTGMDRVFLQEFRVFGGTARGEADVVRALAAATGVALPAGDWTGDRVVSVGYFALVDHTKATPTPDIFSEQCRWWDVRDLPPLLFDHDAIVASALETLRAQARYLPLGASLLPEKFTMRELQHVYEAVLGRPLDRRNFHRWVLDLGFVERLPERKTGSAYRAPYLYRFTEAAATQTAARALAADTTEQRPPAR